MLEAHYTADFEAARMEFLARVVAQLRLLDLRWLARAKGGKG